MYYGPRSHSLYSPQDTKSVQWFGSNVGRDVGSEMQKGHDHISAMDAQAESENQQARQQSMWQAAHERNLQASEQARRQYDSETARAGQQQKYGLLSNLLGGNRMTFGG
jgi:hypothetical protein